jgi:hypothetical protein
LARLLGASIIPKKFKAKNLLVLLDAGAAPAKI